jgi:hypothetical protein
LLKCVDFLLKEMDHEGNTKLDQSRRFRACRELTYICTQFQRVVLPSQSQELEKLPPEAQKEVLLTMVAQINAELGMSDCCPGCGQVLYQAAE